MRYSKAFSIAVACAMSCPAWGQPTQGSQASWIGVWNSTPDERPGLTMTLADDQGELEGTIVFNFIIGPPPDSHDGGTDPHMVKHPRLEGGTLSFQVTRGDGKLLQMAGKLVGSERLELRCVNCGDSPVVTTLVKFVPKL
jgi:hypothetical protein